MNQFKKRDRVVTPDGLGHIVHTGTNDWGQNTYNVKVNNKVRSYAGNLRPATSKDFKKGKAEIWKNDKKHWNFRTIAKNGKPIGGSGSQGYANRVDMIDVLNNNYIDFEIVQVESTKMSRKTKSKV